MNRLLPSCNRIAWYNPSGVDKMKPKLCINNSCKNIIYVPASMLHMCLQCKTCVEKRAKAYDDYTKPLPSMYANPNLGG